MRCIAVLLFASFSLCSAQNTSSCECMAYFLCEDRGGKVVATKSCDDLFDSCCELAESSVPLPISTIPSVEAAPPCQCTPSNQCTGTQYDSVECGESSVCCEMSQSPLVAAEEQQINSQQSTPKTRLQLCGTRMLNNDKVLGGELTAVGEFPWVVAIIRVDAAGYEHFVCAGSIIYSNIILTTAHNIRAFSATNLRVKAGVWDTKNVNERGNHQLRTVKTIILHPNFDQKNATDDVGLLVLDKDLELTDNVFPICFPSSLRQYDSSQCIATGWGKQHFGAGDSTIGGKLKRVDLPIVDSVECQNRLRNIPRLGKQFVLHQSAVCAGGSGRDTCKGDGGSPLICPLLANSNRFVQVGITSWGIGCGENPGVYSSVSYAADWIEKTAENFPTSPQSMKVIPRIRNE